MSSRYPGSRLSSRRSAPHLSANERAVRALHDAGLICIPCHNSYYNDEDRYSRTSSVSSSDSSSSTERHHREISLNRPSRRSGSLSSSHSCSHYSGSEASSSSHSSGSSQYSRANLDSHRSSRTPLSNPRERMSPLIEHGIRGDGFDSSDEEQIALSWTRNDPERFGSRPLRESTRFRYEDFYDPRSPHYRTGVPPEADVIAAAHRIGSRTSSVRRGSDDFEDSFNERMSRLSVGPGSHYGGSRPDIRVSLYDSDSDDGSDYGDSQLGSRVTSRGRSSNNGSDLDDSRIGSRIRAHGGVSGADFYRGRSHDGSRMGYGDGLGAGSYVRRNSRRSSRYGGY